jgi:hypothetical protein
MTTKRADFGPLFWISLGVGGFVFCAFWMAGGFSLTLQEIRDTELGLHNVLVGGIGFLIVILFVACSSYCIRVVYQHRRSTATRLAITVVVTIATPVLIWGVLRITAAQRGYLTARHDVSRGHYEIKTYGLMHMRLQIYSRMLKERYDIWCPPVSGCIVTGGEVAFKNAYNSYAKPAIIQHFGKDVFAECKQDAEAEWRRSCDLLPKEPPRKPIPSRARGVSPRIRAELL